MMLQIMWRHGAANWHQGAVEPEGVVDELGIWRLRVWHERGTNVMPLPAVGRAGSKPEESSWQVGSRNQRADGTTKPNLPHGGPRCSLPDGASFSSGRDFGAVGPLARAVGRPGRARPRISPTCAVTIPGGADNRYVDRCDL